MYLVLPYALVMPSPTGVFSVMGMMSAAPYTVAEDENAMDLQLNSSISSRSTNVDCILLM